MTPLTNPLTIAEYRGERDRFWVVLDEAGTPLKTFARLANAISFAKWVYRHAR